MKKILGVVFILFLLAMLVGCAGPLQLAAIKGDTKAIKEMLDNGADINKSDLDGPPLFWASRACQVEAVRLLLERGADVNAVNGHGSSALTGAAYNGCGEVVKLLIESGANSDIAIGKLISRKQISAAQLVEMIAKSVRERKTQIASKKDSQTTAIKSDIDELPRTKTKQNKNAYAIVIGIESYRQKLPKADYAVADAKIIAEYLIRVMGYPEENIITLMNEHATKSDFEKYFDRWLPNNVEKDSTVFVYFSGHGAPNTKTGDAYLVPYDGDPSFIAETGYSLQRMYETLGKLQAKEIIVALDSCFSGAGGRSVIAKGARPLVMNIQGSLALSKNMTVLSASSGEQISSTYDEKGHGIFTYFLLKGIKNEDVVKPDGSIKMEDLFGYIKPQVERIARKQYNNEQTPQFIR